MATPEAAIPRNHHGDTRGRDPPQQRYHFLAGIGVQPAEWLVQQHQAGPVNHGLGQLHLLLQPHGISFHRTMPHLVHAEVVQHFVRTGVRRFAGHARQAPGIGHRLEPGKPGKEGLVFRHVPDPLPRCQGGCGHLVPHDGDRPLGVGEEPEESPDQSGLARTVGPQQPLRLAPPNVEADIIEGQELPVVLHQAPGNDRVLSRDGLWTLFRRPSHSCCCGLHFHRATVAVSRPAAFVVNQISELLLASL